MLPIHFINWKRKNLKKMGKNKYSNLEKPFADFKSEGEYYFWCVMSLLRYKNLLMQRMELKILKKFFN